MTAPGTSQVRGVELPTMLQRVRDPLPDSALRLARSGARTLGTLTAKHRALPDFLIIGAKKGGTSSLMNWLLQHPAVPRMFPSAQRLKSPHYFDINYWRGPDWYAGHFPTRTARHRTERRLGSLTAVGEASPYYLFHPQTPHRVSRDLPDAKIIAVLREPVSRAYSNYWDRRAFGTETLPTFEQAIDAEADRLAGVDGRRLNEDPRYYSLAHDQFTYLARGRYAEHLSTWLQLVPAPQLLVLNADDLFARPAEVFVQVQRFLGLPVRSDMALTTYNSRAREPMAAQTKARLAAYYRPYNLELYELLGRNFGWETRYPA